ncbi:MAG: FeoA domain-containing protein [Endomicrobiaceae bacterium]|nr:FeoA domain-containing protein [Endomicrobiaceae bacterium]
MSPLTKAKKDTILVFSAFGNIVESEKQKLTDLGLIPGESIQLINEAKNGYITFILKGSRIALDCHIAGEIIVNEVINEN